MRWTALGLLGVLAGGSWQAVDPADQARADALVQAGLQDAEALLRAYFSGRAFEAKPRAFAFWGADVAEAVEPAPGFPPEHAANPSFAVEVDGDPANPDPAPRPVEVGGRTLGFSGVRNPGRHATNGDQYALKISDLSGRLHVNDGLDQGATGSVSQNLRRILNVLGDVVGVPGLGTTILAARPPGGYGSLDELRSALGDDTFEKVRDYLTAHAWVDPDVANPVPLSSWYANTWEARTGVHFERGSPPIYRHGSDIQGVDANGDRIQTVQGLGACPSFGVDSDNIKIYGLDVLNPQWIEIVSRAPVNVNAAPKPVLIALLADLQGFFVSDRARNNPRWKGDLYIGFKNQNALRPRGPGMPSTGDEVGFLLETLPIVPGPSTAVSTGLELSAHALADEIIACRSRRNSPYFNYSDPGCWFAGPFRTWHQFNAFVDNLARPTSEGGAGFIVDGRMIYFRYAEEVDDPTGHGPLVDDPIARRHGVQATADLIKANFNPNLHLNEANPDENLYLRVDKTDLFVNSTEFCFVPTGCFEVQAVGRVLAPAGAATDALTAADNAVKAQSKATAVFQLYDVKRETTQKHFYAGTLAPRGTSWETSNNKSIEIGPEPENSHFPGNAGAPGSPDNEWGGYLALPSIGGLGADKTPNVIERTKDRAPHPSLGAAVYVPFTLDMDAAAHPFDPTEIGSERLGLDDSVDNYPDHVGGAPFNKGGPYDPTDSSAGSLVRIARSYRRTGGAVPALVPYPPSDLRIDGVQAERHAAPAYMVQRTNLLPSEVLWDFSGARATGQVGLWIKPSFFPEITGKIRKVWDMTRYHEPCNQRVHVWPFETVFQPTHYDPALSELYGPRLWHNNHGMYEPCSIYFGSVQWHADADLSLPRSHQFGKITTALNHLGHPDHAHVKPSPLRAHRWMHVGFTWDLVGSDSAGVSSGLWVNGTNLFTKWSYRTMTGGWNEGFDRMYGFESHTGGEFNHMRFGATSRVADRAQAVFGYRGNHSADFTLDEIHVWKEAAQADPRTLWVRGRYLRPDEGFSEGWFTSAPLGLPAGAERRILGLSWTWFGEPESPLLPAENPGDPVLYACNSLGDPGKDLQPRVHLSIRDGLQTYGPFDDAGYSPVLNASSQTPVLQDPAATRYLAQIRLLNSVFGDVLLATPVLDDVTLYWSDGAATTIVGAALPEPVQPFPVVGGGGGSGGSGGCGVLGAEALLLLALLRHRRRL